MAKLLYVEDNEMNRDMLSRRLSRRGYEIIMAFDGQAGLDMMRSEAPDLVLMDMGLPVLDGWEATIQAKADESISSIPIIALTAHALESDKQKALECGADDFDTKPVDFKRLLGKIEAFVGSQFLIIPWIICESLSIDTSSFLTSPITLSFKRSSCTSVKSFPEKTRTGALFSSGTSLI